MSRSITRAKGKKYLGIITARGGSKRLPGKNVRPLGGIPLIGWTVDAAHNSQLNRTILTTDDPKIIEAAEGFGCDVPFIRPSELAESSSSSLDVVNHALSEISGYEYFVLLQPTSPLRTSQDIDQCLNLIEKKSATSVIALSCANKQNKPSYGLSLEQRLVEGPSDKKHPYQVNGAVYVCRTDWFLEKQVFWNESTVGYLMPEDRSVDIDTFEDFFEAEAYLGRLRQAA